MTGEARAVPSVPAVRRESAERTAPTVRRAETAAVMAVRRETAEGAVPTARRENVGIITAPTVPSRAEDAEAREAGTTWAAR